MSSEIDKKSQEINEIRNILKDFLKVIKVVSMYPENNPLPQSLRQSFAEKLENFCENYGPVDISVEKECLRWKDEVVYTDRSKEESLAGLFFNTGITRFTFKETLAVDEIYKLLDVIKEFLNAPKNSVDLAGLIWESGIADFRFATVEDIALSGYDGKLESDMLGAGGLGGDGDDHTMFGTDQTMDYGSLFDPSATIGPVESVGSSAKGKGGPDLDSGEIPKGGSVFFSHAYRDLDDSGANEMLKNEDSLNTVAATRAMGFTDIAPTKTVPNTTLILNDEFKLSEEEEKEFKRMLEEDSIFDMYESTVEILKEILHQETDYTGFNESVTICEKIQSDLIRCGALEYAADLLGFTRELEERIRTSMPQWSDRLKEATLTAGTRERLQFLAQALNDQPEIDRGKIIVYLKNLGWESLGGITDLLGDIEHREHREAVCSYLGDEGKTKVDLISRGIFDKRWFVVRNSAAILARIGDDKSLGYLLKIAGHEEKRVRLSIVENLKGCTNIKALEILSKTVMDQDAEVREKSVQSIIAFKGPEAFDVIEGIIVSEKFIKFEPNDKKVLLEAYSILGGDQAVTALNAMIIRFNFFRNSNIEAQRLAAIQALAINQSEKAEKALLKLASSWRLNIRSLATSALHKRRAVMYGADNADDSDNN